MTLRELVNYATQGGYFQSPVADYDFTVGNQYGHLQPIENVDQIIVSDEGHTVMVKFSPEQIKFLHEFEPGGFEDVNEPVEGSEAGH